MHTPPTATRLLPAALLALATASPAAFGCASCGCTLNTDLGNQGVVSGSGWRLDQRYDLVDQSELRSGTGRVDVTLPATEEVEQDTRNGYYTFSASYGFSRKWGVELQLPYLVRDHSTYAAGDTILSSSRSASFSDARLIGRYTGFEPDMSTGLLFGLKLPTGAHDTVFATGPAAGEPLDRSLQPGSGTTDVLLGGYHFADFGESSGWFAQAMYQHALAAHAGYRPGDSFNVNAGLRYYWNSYVTPQLQLNAQVRARDTDADPAGHDNSGGRLLYLSPGLTFGFGEGWHGFAFVQFPLYQDVYGLQLTPTKIVSVGISYTF